MVATVADDTHNLYLPAIVGLTDLRREDGSPEGDMELIIYNGALRGEIWKGDRIRINTTIINLTTPSAGTRTGGVNNRRRSIYYSRTALNRN